MSEENIGKNDKDRQEQRENINAGVLTELCSKLFFLHRF